MKTFDGHDLVEVVDEYGTTVDERGWRAGIPSIELSIFRGRRSAGENNLDSYAIKAIREIAEMGYPIPMVLLPWLGAACDALTEKKGNVISNYETDQTWRFRIQDTHRLVLGGYSPKDAFDAIAGRDGVKSGSVKRHYYKDHARERQVIEDRIAHLEDFLKVEGAYVHTPSIEEILSMER